MTWKDTLKNLWGNKAEKAERPMQQPVTEERDTEQPSVSTANKADVTTSSTTSHVEDYSPNIGSDQPHISETYRQTQYNAKQSNTGYGEIRIGLDFGTAYTKVVIGTSMGAFAVPLGMDLNTGEDNQYLLAGRLSVEEGGRCHLGSIEGCNQIDGLKMKIIGSEGVLDAETQAHVAAFLALLFRKIRWWWIDQGGAPAELRREKIKWTINGGLPTESTGGVTEKLYRRIILAAWAASVDEGVINLQQIGETCELSIEDKEIVLHDDGSQKEYLMDSSLELIPEFLAQTAVYINHPKIDKLRLHAMVDIGAGTVDMTIFNVYEREGGIRHAIYGKKVVPFGVNYLINNRLKALGIDMGMAPKFYLAPYTDQQFAEQIHVEIESIKECDNRFTNNLAIRFSDLRNKVRTDQEVSSDIRLLQDGIKLFVAGGGSRVEAYKKRIRKFEEDGRTSGGQNRVDIAELPDLGDVEERERRFIAPDLSRKNYDRLSVAYGLSEDVLNLAEQISGADLEKIWGRVRQHRLPINIVDAREEQRLDPNRMPYDD